MGYKLPGGSVLALVFPPYASLHRSSEVMIALLKENLDRDITNKIGVECGASSILTHVST